MGNSDLTPPTTIPKISDRQSGNSDRRAMARESAGAAATTAASEASQWRRLYMRRRRALASVDTTTRRRTWYREACLGAGERGTVPVWIGVPRPGRRRCAQCAAEHTRKRRAGACRGRVLFGVSAGRAISRPRRSVQALVGSAMRCAVSRAKSAAARARQYDTDRQRVQRRLLRRATCPNMHGKDRSSPA